MDRLPPLASPLRRRLATMLTASALCALAFPAAAQTPSALPKVRLNTSMGDIVLELYPDKAPKTVENFLQYVRDKHYDGTVFHRVIGNFMIQGGGFDAKFQEKATRAPVPHEGQAAIQKGGPRNTVGT